MRLNQSRGPKAAEEYFTELPIAATNLFGTSRLRADPPYRLAQEVGGALRAVASLLKYYTVGVETRQLKPPAATYAQLTDVLAYTTQMYKVQSMPVEPQS